MTEGLTDAEAYKFWSKVDRTGDCWIWIGGRTSGGYGQFCMRGKVFYAHRVAFFLESGVDPAGYEILHSCDNPPCVRFMHLSSDTHAANCKDAREKGRHCHGAGVHSAKLTSEDVMAIRELHAAGGLSMKKIGAQFGVTDRAVYLIVSGKRWSHLPTSAYFPGTAGERSGVAKLNWAKVRAIRERYTGGSVSYAELAAEYGISRSHVYGLVHGFGWVEGPNNDGHVSTIASK